MPVDRSPIARYTAADFARISQGLPSLRRQERQAAQTGAAGGQLPPRGPGESAGQKRKAAADPQGGRAEKRKEGRQQSSTAVGGAGRVHATVSSGGIGQSATGQARISAATGGSGAQTGGQQRGGNIGAEPAAGANVQPTEGGGPTRVFGGRVCPMYEDNELLEHASVFIDSHQAAYHGLQMREGADQEYVQERMSAAECIVSAAAFQKQSRFLIACTARHHDAYRQDATRTIRQLEEKCQGAETEAAQWKEEVEAANKRKDAMEKDLEKANQQMARAGERASLQELRVSQLEADLAHTKLERENMKALAEGRLAAFTEAKGKLKKSDEERSTMQTRLDGLVAEFRAAEKERFAAMEADMAEYGKFLRDWAIQKIVQKYPHVDISDINFAIPVEGEEASQATAEAAVDPPATEATAAPITTETAAVHVAAIPLAMPETTPVVAGEQRGTDSPTVVEAAVDDTKATIVETSVAETTAPRNGELVGESQPPVAAPKE